MKTLTEEKIIIFFTAVLIGLYLIPIWLVKFPPLTDYPQHLLASKVIKDYSNPVYNYDKYFTISYTFIPNSICYIIIPLLAYIFPILIAGKICLSLYIILLPLSILYFLNTINKEKLALVFFSFPFIYNGFFNMGFINFCISIPLFFFALGYWWKNKDNIGLNKQACVLIILILGLYLSHLFSFFLFGISIAFLASLTFKNLKKIFVAIFPYLIISLCCFIFFLPHIFAKKGTTATFATFRPLIHKFFLFRSMIPVFSSDIKMVFISFLIILATAVLFFKNFRKSYKNIFFSLTIFLFIVFLLLPFSFPNLGFGYVDLRTIPFIIFIFLSSIYFNKHQITSYICIVSIIILSVFWVFHVTIFYSSVNKKLENYFSIINKIPANKNILPIGADIKKNAAEINPYEHFWAYYHVFKGGNLPCLYSAFVYGFPVQYKNYPKKFYSSLTINNIAGSYFKDIVKNYDYILIRGTRNHLDTTEINKYATLFLSDERISIFKINE